MFNRRAFLRAAGYSLVAGTALMHASPAAWAAARPEGAFKAEKVADAIRELYGSDSFEKSDAVKFKAPEIAENGAVVPVTVEYDGEAKSIAVMVHENPQPLAAAFEMHPGAAAYASTRIKMGKSSIVTALVQKADGGLIGVEREVKVTIGGCGG